MLQYRNNVRQYGRDTETLSPCLHDNGSPTYRIPFHIGLRLCLYGSAIIKYPLLQQSGTTLPPSAGGTKMDPVQSVPFCFTCKRCNPIRNAPKSGFDNKMASVQMRLISYWRIGRANKQRKQQNYFTKFLCWYQDFCVQ